MSQTIESERGVDAIRKEGLGYFSTINLLWRRFNSMPPGERVAWQFQTARTTCNAVVISWIRKKLFPELH